MRQPRALLIGAAVAVAVAWPVSARADEAPPDPRTFTEDPKKELEASTSQDSNRMVDAKAPQASVPSVQDRFPKLKLPADAAPQRWIFSGFSPCFWPCRRPFAL